ncbi:MAG: hypothetical protein A3D31_07695 [Candidatus Fluviicola riflensis]|nr:MAG: hypothetical protein CHH17_07315 [Candidatus Fluviicola riflensis]OGS79827.1 MAG: hypothetical protein A3D31_07695 [Candidatus Fluviicola riflensis]OGS82342.1 MAG: hypothetical protein A2724_16640 [Fluviicola sp. RIFCSPHIGHO2_01_FULL_43_53]OGS88006.1 MAG: hypothetical protein A3E30_14075 [Fluviicola sp. RIFCSPHIGHO2_12_FULL_43_24]
MGAIKPFNYSDFELSVALGARALNHPCRVKMMSLIKAHKGITCVDLAKYFQMSKPSIRDHIEKLKDAGYIYIEYSPHCYNLSIDEESHERFQSFQKFFAGNPASQFYLSIKK